MIESELGRIATTISGALIILAGLCAWALMTTHIVLNLWRRIDKLERAREEEECVP